MREEVYEENKERVPFWECRNWVRPGWCGWQQVNINEPTAEERLGYDLYYIKHRNIAWEIAIFFHFLHNFELVFFDIFHLNKHNLLWFYKYYFLRGDFFDKYKLFQKLYLSKRWKMSVFINKLNKLFV